MLMILLGLFMEESLLIEEYCKSAFLLTEDDY